MTTAFVLEPPTNLGDKNLLSFFQGWNWKLRPNNDLVIDFHGVSYMAPWAITLFALHGLWLKEHDRVRTRLLLDPLTEAGRYIAQAGMFELLDLTKPTGIPEASDVRTVRLTRIKQSQDFKDFADKTMNILQIGDEELEGAVRYSLIELMRNVVQHARSPVGGLAMVQFYPRTGLVDIVVADRGIGILSSLQPRYPEITNDIKAVRYSMMPHVSGTFSPNAYSSMADNAGLGLFFIKEIASRAGGGFFLISKEGLADVWGNADGSLGKQYISARNGGWPGTFAMVQLRKDSIAEFNSLLGVCRELATLARKDPSTVALDFIDEIPDIPGVNVIKVYLFEEDVEAAARIRDGIVIPALARGEMVVLDFAGIKAATQSFVHACLYKVLRDRQEIRHALSIARCSNATREAIRVVAAYAMVNLSMDKR